MPKLMVVFTLTIGLPAKQSLIMFHNNKPCDDHLDQAMVLLERLFFKKT